MQGTADFYDGYLKGLYSASVNLLHGDIRFALLTDTYRPDFLAHVSFEDVAEHEVRGQGYAPGGKALTGKRVARNAMGELGLHADTLRWPGATITAKFGILYQADGAGQPLISCNDFGSYLIVEDEEALVQFRDEGALSLGNLRMPR